MPESMFNNNYLLSCVFWRIWQFMPFPDNSHLNYIHTLFYSCTTDFQHDMLYYCMVFKSHRLSSFDGDMGQKLFFNTGTLEVARGWIQTATHRWWV